MATSKTKAGTKTGTKAKTTARTTGRTTGRFPPRAPKPRSPKAWTLRLYVAGESAKSIRAFDNLHVLCEKHLKGRYRIEVIDLLENPHMARGDQIVAIPTLVVKLPQAVRKIQLGDLSDTDRVLVGLALQPIG